MVRAKLFVCELLLEEAKAAVALEGLEEIEVIPYSSGILSATDSQRSLSALLSETDGAEAVCIIGSEWISSLPTPSPKPRSLHFVKAATCFEILAGRTLTDRLLNQGAYIVYPGSLHRWRDFLAPFDLQSPKEVGWFAETMKKIVLLDTGTRPESCEALEEMAAILKMPFERIEVGLDMFRLIVSEGVAGARLQNEVEHAKQNVQTEARIRADYAMAFELLQEISQESDENRVVSSILSIMDLLFAPQRKDYYSVGDDGSLRLFSGKGLVNAEGVELGDLESINDGYDESLRGFRLRIENKGQVKGMAIVSGIAFPEFWRQYISLGMQMAPVFGLAIANARHFHDLLESEKRVEHALALEKATLAISKLFIGKVVIDEVLPQALFHIGIATQSDRVSFFQISDDFSEMSRISEWCNDSSRSILRVHKSTPLSEQSWLIDRLNEGDELRIGNLSSLPSEVRRQLSPFTEADARSMAMVPIQVDGHIGGFLCLQDAKGPRRWDDDHMTMFRFLGQTLSRTMQERKTQEDVLSVNESLMVTNKVLRHDIKNELMVVNGSLELFALKQERKNMDRAMASTAKIQNLIEQFKQLDAFLLSSKGLFACRVAGTIQQVMVSHQMPYRIDGDAVVMADFALASVIDNLVRNAKTHGKAEWMHFEVRSVGQLVEMEVADDGTGIPVEIRDKIFKEGFSYGESKSTGLGLFLIRKTMERYGGRISVEENRPKGAKFILSFPRGSSRS